MALAFKATTEVMFIAIRSTSPPQLCVIAAVLIVTFTFLRVTQHRERIADRYNK